MDIHNSLRNRIARGEVEGYNPAVRMASMVWSFELEKLAELAVKRCIVKLDQCRNTETFRYTGQNGGKYMWRTRNPNSKSLALNMINQWINENQNCSMTDIRNLTDM